MRATGTTAQLMHVIAVFPMLLEVFSNRRRPSETPYVALKNRAIMAFDSAGQTPLGDSPLRFEKKTAGEVSQKCAEVETVEQSIMRTFSESLSYLPEPSALEYFHRYRDYKESWMVEYTWHSS